MAPHIKSALTTMHFCHHNDPLPIPSPRFQISNLLAALPPEKLDAVQQDYHVSSYLRPISIL